ncbi:MAG: type II toxin-antitoxin system RelE/ParE family toxin [Bacteroidetes bacterium]|nr:type II toxin-antitoxin system RelE/ParE family toxin [Bacteroidota bacterium]
MDNKFEIVLLAEAFEFLKSLDIKHSTKILFNIRKSQQKNDPELFKKLTDEIWEFRTLFQGLQYRMLAFWDKTDNKNTLVISTHGFIKKQSKVPENEIFKAETQRKKYFQDNLKNKK